MFRDDRRALATDLAAFIHAVFRSDGYRVNGEKIVGGQGGDVGDAALLCHSPMENSGERLPGALRRELLSLKNPIELFNPRGEEYRKFQLYRSLVGCFWNLSTLRVTLPSPM